MSSLRPIVEAAIRQTAVAANRADDRKAANASDAALVAYLTAQLDLLAAGDGPKDYDQGPGYTRALDDVRRLLA